MHGPCVAVLPPVDLMYYQVRRHRPSARATTRDGASPPLRPKLVTDARWGVARPVAWRQYRMRRRRPSGRGQAGRATSVRRIYNRAFHSVAGRLSQSLLVLTNLACSRGGRTLFTGLDLDLPAGRYMEVHGPNGGGKSTLLRLAAGLYPDYKGGIDAAASFYLGHKPGISVLLSPRENLQWYARAGRSAGGAGSRTPGDGVAAALAAVGLEASSEIPCGRLSQGQQRRTGLAKALLSPHRLWLLDEPLTALDARGRSLARRFIADHCAAGGAVLCATHQSLDVTDSTVIELGRGR